MSLTNTATLGLPLIALTDVCFSDQNSRIQTHENTTLTLALISCSSYAHILFLTKGHVPLPRRLRLFRGLTNYHHRSTSCHRLWRQRWRYSLPAIHLLTTQPQLICLMTQFLMERHSPVNRIHGQLPSCPWYRRLVEKTSREGVGRDSDKMALNRKKKCKV